MFATFQTFTDTGIPRLVIRFSADTHDPCLGFLLRQRSRLHGVAENALLALHRKLGIVAQVVARDLLPGEAALLCNDLNMVVALGIASA